MVILNQNFIIFKIFIVKGNVNMNDFKLKGKKLGWITKNTLQQTIKINKRDYAIFRHIFRKLDFYSS